MDPGSAVAPINDIARGTACFQDSWSILNYPLFHTLLLIMQSFVSLICLLMSPLVLGIPNVAHDQVCQLSSPPIDNVAEFSIYVDNADFFTWSAKPTIQGIHIRQVIFE